jgi:RNA polymerase sigma-70 factor (ECF subfamily)
MVSVHTCVVHADPVIDDFDDVLARARTGAGEAFTVLYQDLSKPVAAYVRTQGVADVEDLTSEVFMAVFTGLSRFEGDQAGFRSWVFTIAHHRVADHWRRAARSLSLTSYDPMDDERTVPSAEAGAFESLGSQEVAELLAGLTEEQREVLTLRVVADLTVEQVADVVGRSLGAVKALQRRALATLRRQIEGEAVPL